MPILERVGILHDFEAVVDGVASDRLHLRGKPEPDIFLTCLQQLVAHGNPQRAGIAEDAIAGVEAGRRGGFGLVLGIDRHNAGDLSRHGANWSIQNFKGIGADQILAFFAAHASAA